MKQALLATGSWLLAPLLIILAWPAPAALAESSWTTYRQADGGLIRDDVADIGVAPDGSTWFASGAGVSQLTANGQWLSYTPADSGIADRYVQSLAIELAGPMAGTIWFTHLYSGVSRRDAAGNWTIFNPANTQGGLLSTWVNAVAMGPDGSAWFGTDSGLSVHLPNGQWQTYTAASTNGKLPSDYVTALAFVGPNLWIGTGIYQRISPYSNVILGTGLSVLQPTGAWTTYTRASTGGALSSDFIHDIAGGADGSIWAATSPNWDGSSYSVGGGLARRLPNSSQWETFTPQSTNGGLASLSLYAVAVAPGATPGGLGTIWAGSYLNGASRFEEGTWTTYTKATSGIGANTITSIAVAPSGAVWFGTLFGGASRFACAGTRCFAIRLPLVQTL